MDPSDNQTLFLHPWHIRIFPAIKQIKNGWELSDGDFLCQLNCEELQGEEQPNCELEVWNGDLSKEGKVSEFVGNTDGGDDKEHGQD